jgi:HPt (histidine-containing phosphotransfer) domain-containing protein
MPVESRRFAVALFVAGVLLAVVGLVLVANVNAAIDRATVAQSQIASLAGQQRDLAASLSKNALLIQNEALLGRSYVDPHAELVVAADTFDQTLRAFKNGGTATLSTGETIEIERLPADEQPLVDDAFAIWNKANDAIAGSANQIELSRDEITKIALIVVGNGNGLGVLMNDLSADIARSGQARLASLSTARTLWSALAILGFIVVLVAIFARIRAASASANVFSLQLQGLIDNLARQTRAIAGAKSRSDMIMGTVRQGLLLLDRDFSIAPQYSRELETIFRTSMLEGRNFLDVLRFVVSERTYKTAKDYMDMLFDEEKSDRTLARINPLEEAEVNFSDATTGGYETRFLEIEFRRIRDEDDAIVQVFCAISDITERVRLTREIRETEARKERQFGMLLGIMYLAPAALDEFVVTVAENLQTMNDAMKAEEVAGLVRTGASSGQSQEELRKRLRTVYRCVHTIKGAASTVRLEFFERKAHDVETRIAELGRKQQLTGDDFLAIVLAQSELRADLEELDELRRNLKNVRAPGPTNGVGAGTPTAQPPTLVRTHEDDTLLDDLRELATTVAKRQGKLVTFEADDLDLRSLDEARRRSVRAVLVQLVRNAVVHGIESPDERARQSKARRGTLLLQRIGNDAGAFGVMLHDDGRGIDTTAIRRRAVAIGMLSAQDAETISDDVAIAALFEPGFSTADESSLDAGRGVGLDIVKTTVMDELGGEIFVRTEAGRYTSISFTVPLEVAVGAGS